MPPIYKWRVRRRIYRWYSELEALDPAMNKDIVAGDLERNLALLDELEEKILSIHVPLAYTDMLYHFRIHIDLLRKKLNAEKSRMGAGNS
jgi:hypothetical protein